MAQICIFFCCNLILNSLWVYLQPRQIWGLVEFVPCTLLQQTAQTWLPPAGNIWRTLSSLSSAFRWTILDHTSQTRHTDTDRGAETVQPGRDRCQATALHEVAEHLRCRSGQRQPEATGHPRRICQSLNPNLKKKQNKTKKTIKVQFRRKISTHPKNLIKLLKHVENLFTYHI